MASWRSIQIPWCQNYSSISSSTLPAIWLLEHECCPSSCWNWEVPGTSNVNIKHPPRMASVESVSPTYSCLTPSSFGAVWPMSSLKIKMEIHRLSQDKSRLPFALLTDFALLCIGKGNLGDFGFFTITRNKSTCHKALMVVAQENK